MPRKLLPRAAAGATLLSLAYATTSCVFPATGTVFRCPANYYEIPEDAIPSFKRVFMVVLENTDANAALKQPFFSKLVGMGASLEKFHATARPSQPNYIAMIAGSNLGVDSNGDDYSLEEEHIGDLLERKGKTWKAYAESYPGDCYLKGAAGGVYARKHVPFLSFKNVQEDPERCARVVPASQLENDVESGELPDFSMYIPNNINNGHDSSVEHADRWLKRTFEPLIENPVFMDGTLLIITFDEAHKDTESNQIYTVLIGDQVKPGSKSGECYDHYGLLRTIEDALGLGSLEREDSVSNPIQGVWM